MKIQKNTKKSAINSRDCFEKKAFNACVRAIASLPNYHNNEEINLNSEIVLDNGKNLLEETEKVIKFRYLYDDIALKLKFHSESIQTELLHKCNEVESFVLAMEQIRYHIIGMRFLPGIEKNIFNYYSKIYENFHVEKIPSAKNILDILILVTLKEFDYELSRVKSSSLITQIENLLKDDLLILKTTLYDQYQYGVAINNIIQKLNDFFEFNKDQHTENYVKSLNEKKEIKEEQQTNSLIDKEPEVIEERKNNKAIGNKTEKISSKYSLDNSALEGTKYKIYTKQFDEVINANNLATDNEKLLLRKQLDSRLQDIRNAIQKKSNKFLYKLYSKKNIYWEFNLEEGLLDSNKLNQFIIDPMFIYGYKNNLEKNQYNTIVTLLVDNSGSMRGRPITVAAICVDIITAILERCGIRTEILGFTTSAWRGGKSKELWAKNNRPANPGRLSDLRHIIYKTSMAPWKKSRKNIGIMLKDGLLKENVDGEALAWTYNRLIRAKEKRKILLVISDGAPVDDSTISANSSYILEDHLKEVINNIEFSKKVELIAIGIGHNVNKYYKNSITINDVDTLGDTILDKLAEIIL